MEHHVVEFLSQSTTESVFSVRHAKCQLFIEMYRVVYHTDVFRQIIHDIDGVFYL